MAPSDRDPSASCAREARSRAWRLKLGVYASLVYLCSPSQMDALAAGQPIILADAPSRCVASNVEPAPLIEVSGLVKPGFGSVVVRAADGKLLKAHIYRPAAFDPLHGPIWFVMHGVNRDATRYLETAAPVAERYAALTLAPEFSRRDFPRDQDYTLAVTTRGNADERALAEGRWRAPDRYGYAEVERLFEALRLKLGGRQDGYFLFGHSAGAQFAHRLVTFMPCPRVLGAVAANAGWYTLPVKGEDASVAMPYGLRGTPLRDADIAQVLRAPLTLLLGAGDTDTSALDHHLRDTAAAMAQGETRLARGQRYYETGKAAARTLGVPFQWRLAVLPGATHEVREVIASAGYLLFSGSTQPCQSSLASEAGGLVINEVLADPPRGEAGDANGDGARHARDDEFIEFINAGSRPLCLAGWTLRDASGRGGHLFALGEYLAPGHALLVFGGGVPVRAPRNVEVQRATAPEGLSLSSKGDVLTLRDARGNPVMDMSWGDCDGAPCAADHWPGKLDFGASLQRWPELSAKWQRHRDIARIPFSAGRRADSKAW